MSVNNKFLVSTLFVGLSLGILAVPAIADIASPSPSASSYGMTSGRLVATTAALLALVGVVLGGLALARPKGLFGVSGKLGAVLALIAGLIGSVVGGLRVATAGGIGTGGGRAGAIVALILGLIALALGATALMRSRRTAEQTGEKR